ncbi:MAG: ASCH domain-containing protein [Armatimonadota bacterium]|nr:ASCH domain-containing protein [Armatimonadota bacterium]
MFALNFYSELYADMLNKGRKTATIRLGDKSDKYRSGQLVWITVGRRFGPRQKLFTAIIDEVDVKPAGDLTAREIEKENPEMRLPEEVMTLLSRIYDHTVTPLDLVTVIHFSPIWDSAAPAKEQDIFERWT